MLSKLLREKNVTLIFKKRICPKKILHGLETLTIDAQVFSPIDLLKLNIIDGDIIDIFQLTPTGEKPFNIGIDSLDPLTLNNSYSYKCYTSKDGGTSIRIDSLLRVELLNLQTTEDYIILTLHSDRPVYSPVKLQHVNAPSLYYPAMPIDNSSFLNAELSSAKIHIFHLPKNDFFVNNFYHNQHIALYLNHNDQQVTRVLFKRKLKNVHTGFYKEALVRLNLQSTLPTVISFASKSSILLLRNLHRANTIRYIARPIDNSLDAIIQPDFKLSESFLACLEEHAPKYIYLDLITESLNLLKLSQNNDQLMEKIIFYQHALFVLIEYVEKYSNHTSIIIDESDLDFFHKEKKYQRITRQL